MTDRRLDDIPDTCPRCRVGARIPKLSRAAGGVEARFSCGGHAVIEFIRRGYRERVWLVSASCPIRGDLPSQAVPKGSAAANGRKPTLDDGTVQALVTLTARGLSLRAVASDLGVPRSTAHAAIKRATAGAITLEPVPA